MRKRTLAGVFVAMLFLFVAGCATLKSAEHRYFMKGQILEVSDGQAYLCIGSAEGAKAGQEFPVYSAWQKTRLFREIYLPRFHERGRFS
jgi:hypothetical protein